MSLSSTAFTAQEPRSSPTNPFDREKNTVDLPKAASYGNRLQPKPQAAHEHIKRPTWVSRTNFAYAESPGSRGCLSWQAFSGIRNNDHPPVPAHDCWNKDEYRCRHDNTDGPRRQYIGKQPCAQVPCLEQNRPRAEPGPGHRVGFARP